MKLSSPWLAQLLFDLLVLFSFLSTNTDLVFRTLFLAGLISGYLYYAVERKDRLLFLGTLMLVTPVSFFITIYFHSCPLKLDWVQFIYPGIMAASFLIGLLIKRIPVEKAYKISFLLSFVAIYIIAGSRKFGEGWYAVACMLSYSAAAFYLYALKTGKRTVTVISFAVLPILIFLFGSERGLILYFVPAWIVALLMFLFIFYNYKATRRSTLYFSVIVTFVSALTWLLNENYTFWYNSRETKELVVNLQNLPGLETNYAKATKEADVKVYLFWSAHCGYCRYEYPYFSELAEEYNNNEKVSFDAVFLTFREKDSLYYMQQSQEKYKFTWSRASNTEYLTKQYQIDGVPVLLIMNKVGKVYYKGYCHIRPWIMVNSPQYYIKKALKEI